MCAQQKRANLFVAHLLRSFVAFKIIIFFAAQAYLARVCVRKLRKFCVAHLLRGFFEFKSASISHRTHVLDRIFVQKLRKFCAEG